MRRLPNICGIYLITVTRPDNLPLYYVGQSIQCRRRRTYHYKTLKARRHDNSKLQNAYNKYGVAAVKFEVVEECGHDCIDALEQWWLDEMHGHQRVLNIAKDATSPNRGRTFSAETRKKVSDAGKGRFVSEETRRLRSEAHKGKTISAETKLKIAKTKLERRDSYIKRIGVLHKRSRPVEGTSIATGEKIILESTRQGGQHGFPDNSAICKVCSGKWPYYKGWTWRYLDVAPCDVKMMK